VGFAGACSVVGGDSEGLNVMFVIAIASSLAVAVTEPTAGGCADVDVVVFCFSPAPSIEPIYIMIPTRSFSSIFPSKALMPWSNPSLYCAGFLSSSSAVFERFAASFLVVVFDFFLLRAIPLLFFFTMMFLLLLLLLLLFFLVLVVIKIEQVQ